MPCHRREHETGVMRFMLRVRRCRRRVGLVWAPRTARKRTSRSSRRSSKRASSRCWTAPQGKLTKGTDLMICYNGGRRRRRAVLRRQSATGPDYLEHAPGIDSRAPTRAVRSRRPSGPHGPCKEGTPRRKCLQARQGFGCVPRQRSAQGLQDHGAHGRGSDDGAIQAVGAIAVRFDVYDDIFQMTKNANA